MFFFFFIFLLAYNSIYMQLLFFIVFLLGFTPNSVRIKYDDRDKFWLLDRNLYQVTDGRIFVRNLESNQNYTINIKNKDFDFEQYYNQVIDKRVLFFEKSGGLVYELLHDTLLRIDNSYSHKLHNKSLNFSNNGIHYRFGGYGFFERSTSLIYYDFWRNEWDLKYNFENVLKNGYSDFSFHSIYDDKLQFFGAHISSEDGFSNLFVDDIIEINLKDNSLKRLGHLNDDFPKIFRNYIDYKDEIFLLKDPKTIYIYNKEKNSFFIYKTSLNPQHLIGVVNNRLYFYSHKTYERDNLEISYIELESILKEKNKYYSIFKNSNSNLLYIIFVFLIVFIMILTLENKIKSNKKLFIKKDEITTKKGDVIMMTDEQRQLLIFLKNNGEVDNNLILDLLGNNTYDLGHQNRVKNKLIKSINDIFFSRFGSDLILSKKNITDKRSVLYYLNEKIV